MTICGEPRDTSQGNTHCHQPEHDPWADHIGILTDPDGGVWIASWNGNWTQLRQQRGIK